MVYNAVPMLRSANAAAARLVTEKFGPQVGRLGDPQLGQVFRTDYAPIPLEELPVLGRPSQFERSRVLKDAPHLAKLAGLIVPQGIHRYHDPGRVGVLVGKRLLRGRQLQRPLPRGMTRARESPEKAWT